MPELPEVESMRRYLETRIVGNSIKEVIVLNPNSIAIKSTVIGQPITHLTRIGKKLFIHLSNTSIISVHFKMSGSFYLRDRSNLFDEHDRVIFDLGTYSLCFHDPRKFGKIVITSSIEEAYKNVGIDALSDELDTFTLLSLLKKHHIGIKRFLLDQTYISGIGNIYVDEILFASFIHPQRISSSITQHEGELLVKNMRRILSLSIAKGGTSLGNGESNYQVQGKRGEFQHALQVFGKKGLPCPRCNTPIIKTKVSSRGTHICPTCQNL
jgi:formamidopyrimidine-DNA glycosylase